MAVPFRNPIRAHHDFPIRNAIDWFELPVAQFDRAVAFYESVLDTPAAAGEHGRQTAGRVYDEPGVGAV